MLKVMREIQFIPCSGVNLFPMESIFLTFFLFFIRFASRESWALPGARLPHNFNAIRAYTQDITESGVRYCRNPRSAL